MGILQILTKSEKGDLVSSIVNMETRRLQKIENNGDGLFPNFGIGLLWCPRDDCSRSDGVFASIGQMGKGFGISPNSLNSNGGNLKLQYSNLHTKYMAMAMVEPSFRNIVGVPELVPWEVRVEEGEKGVLKKKKKGLGFKMKIKIGNSSMRRLISGAIAGAVSRTVVAPLETIRTHLMVGSCGHSSTEVFQDIMKNEGWKGLFRGNFVNVIRVAPSKAIEVRFFILLFDF